MIVIPSTLPSITPTTLPSDVPSEKPSDKPSIHPLQSPTGLPRFVPYIQASDFRTHVPSVYSGSRSSYWPSHLPILYTSLNPIVVITL